MEVSLEKLRGNVRRGRVYKKFLNCCNVVIIYYMLDVCSLKFVNNLEIVLSVEVVLGRNDLVRKKVLL